VIRKSDNFAEQFIISVLAQFLERRQVGWAVSVASGSIYHRVNLLKIGRPDETTPRTGSVRKAYVIHSSLFASMICACLNQNTCILNFLYCSLPRPHLRYHLKLNSYSKSWNLTVQINAHQEGTKVNIKVNGRVLKNLDTYWNIRHHCFQLVPISFSLARVGF